jgi:hypothetical protein
MTEIWMGYTAILRAKEQGRLHLTGDRQLAGAVDSWLGLSPFARVEKKVA